MPPRLNTVKIAPFLGPKFQTLIDRLVQEILQGAYMNESEVEHLSMPLSGREVINYYVAHCPPLYKENISQILAWMLESGEMCVFQAGSFSCPENRLTVIIPLHLWYGQLQFRPGIHIEIGRGIVLEKSRSVVWVGDGKLLAIVLTCYEAIYSKGDFKVRRILKQHRLRHIISAHSPI